MTLVMAVTAAIETFNFESTNRRSTLTQLYKLNCNFIERPRSGRCNFAPKINLTISAITLPVKINCNISNVKRSNFRLCVRLG